ncbi:MAG TPA: GAF domain-containing protein [Acidimicrobiales bacterium]|nr:GAF domain-containing protein [Acidimicrobiales bacterium]
MARWDRDRALVEARNVGLPSGHATLSDVDRRRLQLLGFAVVVLAGIVRLATLPPPAAASTVPVDVVRPLLAALGATVVLYVADRERRLRRLTRWLIEERAESSERLLRLEEVHAVLDVVKAVNSAAPLDAVFSRVVTAAAAAVSAKASALELLVDDTVHVAASTGPGPAAGSSFPLSGHPAERVATTWEASVGATDAGDRVLRVPVRHVTELLGALMVEVDGTRWLSEHDVRAVEVFAECAAAAIAHAGRLETARKDQDDRDAKDAARGRWAARASDVVRDPVASMLAATKLLQRKQLDAECLELTRVIERQAQRVKATLEELVAGDT